MTDGGDAAGELFTPELYRFLRELARNNNREWFQKNKDRYERVVREPSFRFIRAVGPGLARLSRHLVADDSPSGGSLYRIYRDIRFSKDKSPYKTMVGINFYHSRMGERGGSFPGFYLHLLPGENFVGAGVWGPDPAAVTKIRDAIVADPSGWKKARVLPLTAHGETLKKVPRGYDPEHPMAEDLKRKDFISSAPLTDAAVTGSDFPKVFLARCAELDPLNRFVAKAIGIDY